MLDRTDLVSDQEPTPVFQHRSQPGWGAAVVAWEREGKRGFQFEDGEVRIFTAAYGHLMESVDVPSDRAARLLALAGRATHHADAQIEVRKRTQVTLDQQLDYLVAKYPGGFAGEAWTTEHRRASGRRLKRHRDAMITRAREELAAPRLDEWIATGQPVAGITALRALLDATDLVTSTATKPLTELGSYGAPRALAALRDLLWADTPFSRRFDTWVTALVGPSGQRPSWLLATAPLALVHPTEQVCIHPATFQLQASWMAPQLRVGSLPMGGLYERALQMVRQIRDRATERGTAPADLLDIYDFMCLTLSAKARAEIAAH